MRHYYEFSDASKRIYISLVTRSSNKQQYTYTKDILLISVSRCQPFNEIPRVDTGCSYPSMRLVLTEIRGLLAVSP